MDKEFSYDKDTGIVTRLKDGFTGSVLNGSYVVFKSLENGKEKAQLAHRVAARLVGWDIDSYQVDHINGNGLDNRLCNLRLATHSQNKMNTKKQTNNTSGLKRVSRCGTKWRADIQIDGKQKYLGMFNTPEEAYKEYCKAADTYHKDFANYG